MRDFQHILTKSTTRGKFDVVVYWQENKTLSSIVILYKNRILFQITRSYVLF